MTSSRSLHGTRLLLLAQQRRFWREVEGPHGCGSCQEDLHPDGRASGGRLAYLGGNGFAAVVAFTDDLMELRRGPTQAGRTWDGPLAEMPLALTNEVRNFRV